MRWLISEKKYDCVKEKVEASCCRVFGLCPRRGLLSRSVGNAILIMPLNVSPYSMMQSLTEETTHSIGQPAKCRLRFQTGLLTGNGSKKVPSEKMEK